MFKSISLLIITAMCCLSCNKDSNGNGLPVDVNRTVIHYMVADNNLYPCAEWDINEMESAWQSEFDGHMVVFLYPVPKSSGYIPSYSRDEYNENPRLILITSDEDDQKIHSQVIKEYTRELDPCDPPSMRAVINDAMQLSPSASYALNLWSHGSGWIPKGLGQPLKSIAPYFDLSVLTGSKIDPTNYNPLSISGAVSGYSIGVSNTFRSELEIDQLAEALSPLKFDFIMFDACHMASIEVLYQLRNVTRYVISSVAETWNTGAPYDMITAPMMATTADVVAIAKGFYDYYNAEPEGTIYRSATISVVDCSALPDLAAAVSDLCSAGVSVSPRANQQFGRSDLSFQNTFFDLGDMVRTTWAGRDLTAFEHALARAVKYEAATPWLFHKDGYNDGGIRVDTHSGISCFIPRESAPRALAAYRERFQWSVASGMSTLVP